MALRITIDIPITRQRLEALYLLYNWIIDQMEVNDSLEYLIQAHAKDLHFTLESQLHKKWRTHTLKLAEKDAIAFCELWAGYAITDPLARITVLDIMQKIDKTTNHAKATTYGKFK